MSAYIPHLRIEIWGTPALRPVVLGLAEEADGGDAAGSGFEAEGDAFVGNASQGEDGSLLGDDAGGFEGIEAEAMDEEFAVVGFAEDRAEEDQVGGAIAGAFDFFEGVAGDADDGRKVRCGVTLGLMGEDLAGLFDGELGVA